MTTRPAPTPTAGVDHLAGRDTVLDGLRGVAAIAVVLTHAGDWSDAVAGPFGRAVQQLNVGVEVFFAISAVLLYRPFARAHLRGHEPPALRTYFSRRFLRIYPAYWLALAVVIPLSPSFNLYTASQRITTPLLLQTYTSAGLRSDVGLRQAWTLVVEVSFYAFLPMYAALVRAAGRRVGAWRAEIGAVAILFLAGPAFSLLGARESPLQTPLVMRVLPPLFGVFAVGIALALVDAWGTPDRPRARVLNRIGASALPWWLAAGALYWLLAAKVAADPLCAFTVSLGQQFAHRIVTTLIAAAVVAPAILGRPDRDPLLRAVASRPLAVVGMFGYGIYLWHYAALELLVARWAPGYRDPAGLCQPVAPELAFWQLAVAGTAFAIALGALSWYLVERPSIRLGHRIRRTRADSA